MISFKISLDRNLRAKSENCFNESIAENASNARCVFLSTAKFYFASRTQETII